MAVLQGAAFNDQGNPQAGMGSAIGDVNADGLLDLLKTHFADDIPALYRNLGRGMFEDIATIAGLAVQNRYVEWGAGLPDLDNDGWPDVFYVTGHVYPEVEKVLPQYPHKGPRIVFRNLGNGRFADVTSQSGAGATEPRSSRGAAFGDFDNDGDVDVLVMNMNERPSLLRNDYSGTNGWLTIALEGRQSNRAAIGATVIVTAAGRQQARAVVSQASYYSHDDLRLHFGLGAATKADRVEVRWPSGSVQILTDVRGKASSFDHRIFSSTVSHYSQFLDDPLTENYYREWPSSEFRCRIGGFMGRRNVHARTSRAGILVTILCGLTATVLPAPCSAQAVYGSIGGTVKDASGAVLPGVTVTIVSNARQTSDSVVTNESGRFVKERLLPGEYKVQAELTGFRMAVVPNVIVGVDAQTPVEFVLDVGQLTEQVEVTGGSTLLTTDRADVATRFDSKQITDLPVLDRNFTKFILLTPGTQQLRVAACRQREPAGVDADDGERAAFQRHGLPAGRH